MNTAVFEMPDLVSRAGRSGERYVEFLRVPALSAGLYRLPRGASDGQSPHREDEVYYVAAGRAAMTVGDEEHAVRAGSVVYVRAGVLHRFHDITEDLSLLVLFAPAETTAAC